ncbi:MAG: lipopolysaccharide biosynthesis protein [Bacteroidales bacterium]|nr:lipopolysaccharide biosynthesis protein [Bacteroidales bacterium]
MSVIDQKKIAKNTALLYVRMLFIMLISFYTSREVLDALGEIDYGIYNAVGGIVVAFSFLNGIMSSACQRYFSIEIGRSDYAALARVFKLNVTVFIALGLIILLLSESFGLWFLNHKMVYPPERYTAVQWVFQTSIIAFILNMMSTPYRSMIIAKEKMKVFAYCGVVEAVLKLLIVYVLLVSQEDKLIVYALLMLVVTIGINAFYYVYCRRYYAECRYRFYWNYPLFKEIIGYTAWNVCGGLAGVGKSQGINILLNMFFGPKVNAARGVAYQVYMTINQFVTNYMMATNPQIIKAYASGIRKEMMKLVFQSSRFSYYLLFILIMPLFMEMDFVLNLWLKEVPEHTALFTRLILVNALIDTLATPFYTSIQATGKVKWYQITVGGSLLLIVPIAYILLKFRLIAPEGVFIVSIVMSVLAHVFRMISMKRQLELSIASYVKEVLWNLFYVTILSTILPLLLCYLMPISWLRFCLSVSLAVLSTSLVVYTVGLSMSERTKIRQIIIRKFKRNDA